MGNSNQTASQDLEQHDSDDAKLLDEHLKLVLIYSGTCRRGRAIHRIWDDVIKRCRGKPVTFVKYEISTIPDEWFDMYEIDSVPRVILVTGSQYETYPGPMITSREIVSWVDLYMKKEIRYG
jgi:hypothetical protein